MVTSKDAVKISALLSDYITNQVLSAEYTKLISRLWVLPVTAVLSDNCYDNLNQQLKALGIEADPDVDIKTSS